MEALNDFVISFFREKLAMRSGEIDKAKSVINPKLIQLGQTIGEQLGHIGNLDGDCFVTESDEVYVLEFNPRFGGGYPFSHEAGMNTAAVYIEWLKGHKDIAQFSQYKSGLAFAKCDRMMKVN